MNGKRIGKILITREMMANLFKERNTATKVVKGLSEFSEVLSMTYDTYRDIFVLIVKDPEFKEIEEGEEIPIYEIEYVTFWAGAKND